jgi:cobalt-zinc-cadmium efflux system membrane fusion protein
MKIIYYIFLSALLITACKGSVDNTNDKTGQKQPLENANMTTFTPEQIRNGGIDTGKLQMHELSGTIQVNGQVDVPPENLLSVNVPMGGFLKKTTMLPGEPVRKGQIIAEIQNQDYITIQQDYLTAKSRITYLKQEMERQQVLSQQQASPLKLYQQSLADYNSEQAQAAGLAQKLTLLGINPQKLTTSNISSVINIYSPMSGFVSRVNINMGKYVNPTDVLMELVNTDDIHAALTVFEKDIPKIAIGNQVKISLPSLPDHSYPGKVILIGRMLDTSHSVMVHCHFLKSDKNLLPNMFLQANIETVPQKTLAVPDGALVDYNGKRYVFVSNPHGKNVEFSMLPVEVGVQESGWNAIKLSKPELEDRDFVLKGAFAILSAMKNTGEGD